MDGDIAKSPLQLFFNDLKGVNGRGEIGPKGGLSVLLVTNLRANPGDDLDTSDNGVLNRRLWGDLLDSIGYGDQPFETRLTLDVQPEQLQNGRLPGTLCRQSLYYFHDVGSTCWLICLDLCHPTDLYHSTSF